MGFYNASPYTLTTTSIRLLYSNRSSRKKKKNLHVSELMSEEVSRETRDNRGDKRRIPEEILASKTYSDRKE